MRNITNRFRIAMIRIIESIPSWAKHPTVLSAVGVAMLLTAVLLFHTRRVERIESVQDLIRYADQGLIRTMWIRPDRIEGEFNEASIVTRGLGSPARFRLDCSGTLQDQAVSRLEHAGVERIQPKQRNKSANGWIVPMTVGVLAALAWIFRREWIATLRRSGIARFY